jgi:hypothetical protein
MPKPPKEDDVLRALLKMKPEPFTPKAKKKPSPGKAKDKKKPGTA